MHGCDPTGLALFVSREACEADAVRYFGGSVADIHRYTLATPPAVSEPFEKIEELPDVLPAQTEQDTEATVWVDGETMAALVALAERVSCDDCTTLREYSALTSVVERCRVAPEVG